MSNKQERKKIFPCPALFCCARLWSLSYVTASEKINEKESSKIQEEEEAFRPTKEAIVPALKSVFQPPVSRVGMETDSSTYCDSWTQTEWTGGWESPPIGLFPFSQNNLMQSSAILFDDHVEHHYETLEEAFAAHDEEIVQLEYEEVTLYKSHCEEKLGLTLCYANPDEPETNIFVSEIEPDSLAAKDGRIMEGDQLLQVNGVDVRNREQAVSLFSSKEPEVTLLLSRPRLQGDDEDDEEERLEDFPKEFYMLQQRQSTQDSKNDVDKVKNTNNEADWSFISSRLLLPHGTVPNQDINPSSSNQTDEKCASTTALYDVSPENNSKKDPYTAGQPSDDSKTISRVQSDTSLDKEMAALNKEMQSIQIECESLVSRHIREQWFRCRAGHQYVATTMEPVSSIPPLEPSLPTLPNEKKKESVAQWVKNVTFENRKHNKPNSSFTEAMAARGVPLTLELAPIPDCTNGKFPEYDEPSKLFPSSPKLVDKSTQLCESDVASIVSCDTCRYCQVLVHQKRTAEQNDRGVPSFEYSQPQQQFQWYGAQRGMSRTTSSDPFVTEPSKLPAKPASVAGRDFIDRQVERNKNYVTFYPCATMYTNQENLQHTIWLQQQLFRQALAHKHYKKASTIPTCTQPVGKQWNQKYPSSSFDSLPPTRNLPYLRTNQPPSTSKSPVITPTEEPSEETKMEWKVKRRPDGTRYITRRPVRNKILKERALQIMEERCGLTTDDDALSELKTGKYWTREERKRHLEKARDRKQRKEILMKSIKLSEDKNEEDDDSSQGKKDGLSKKKIYYSSGRRKLRFPSTPSSTVLDDCPSACHGTFGILSVTTV